MGKFTDNIVNQRFNYIYKHLISNNIISTKTELANKLNTYNHVVNSILNGDRSLTTAQINNLCHTFNVNTNYLFGASNQLFNSNAGTESISKSSNIAILTAEQLLTGTQQASTTENLFLPGIETPHFAYRHQGDSMFPTLSHGDLLIYEEEDFMEIRNNLIYLVVTDAVHIKRIQKIQKKGSVDGIRMISDNTMYPPFELDIKEVVKVGRIKSRWSKQGLK